MAQNLLHKKFIFQAKMIDQKIIETKIKDWILLTKQVNPTTLTNHIMPCEKDNIKNAMRLAFSMIEIWDLLVSDIIISPQVNKIVMLYFEKFIDSHYLNVTSLWGADINYTDMSPQNILLISYDSSLKEELNKDNRYVSLCQIDFEYLERISNLTAFW